MPTQLSQQIPVVDWIQFETCLRGYDKIIHGATEENSNPACVQVDILSQFKLMELRCMFTLSQNPIEPSLKAKVSTVFARCRVRWIGMPMRSISGFLTTLYVCCPGISGRFCQTQAINSLPALHLQLCYQSWWPYDLTTDVALDFGFLKESSGSGDLTADVE